MVAVKHYLKSQFGHPRGALGWVAGKVMARKNRERIDWTVSLLGVEPHDQVLEIGFGPGVAIEQVARYASDGFIAGVDRSATMLRQAEKRNAAAILEGRVALQQGSADVLPYEAATFDKVFAINVSLFWSQPLEVLQQVHRVLKPSGLLALTFQPPLNKKDTIVREAGDQIEQLLINAGYRETRLAFKPMEPCASVCALGSK